MRNAPKKFAAIFLFIITFLKFPQAQAIFTRATHFQLAHAQQISQLFQRQRTNPSREIYSKDWLVQKSFMNGHLWVNEAN